MPRRRSPASNQLGSEKATTRPFCVLLVDREPQVHRQLEQVISERPMHLIQARGIAEARRCVAEQRIDLALVESNLPDGSGLSLAEELCGRTHPPQAIIISDQPSFEQAIGAIRSGASDFLVKPLDQDELSARVKEAIGRRQLDQHIRRRMRRLRRICQKLSRARDEVTRQVDVLCNDLVSAYQDLSVQMHNVVHTSEFAAQVRHELDLESLVRKTLEFVLAKSGPTNAVLFLPASMHEFTVGGYINYDTSSSSADVLLDHMADVLAPNLASRGEPVHITNNDDLPVCVGDDATYLQDCHLLGLPCRHEDETLAVLVLFRHETEPFDTELIETLTAIAPLLGDYLAKLIRVHHRHFPDIEEDDDTS